MKFFIGSQLEKGFWPTLCVGRSVQILEILMYSCYRSDCYAVYRSDCHAVGLALAAALPVLGSL